MSTTAVDELRQVWGGVRVDDVRSIDRALRTGSELNRSPVETASYVFASDPSLRRVAAGSRSLPGAFVDVLAGDSNEGVVVALLRAHADRVGDEALAEVIRWRRLRVTRVLVENRLLTDWQISVMGIDLMRNPEDYERMRPWERESAGPFEKGDKLVVRALQARLDAGDPVSSGALWELVERHGGRVAMWCVKHADDYALSDVVLAAVRVSEDAALAAVAREETMPDRVLLAAVDTWESVAVKVARDSVGLRPSVRDRLMGDDRGKVLSAFASRKDVSDAELTLLVSRSQSVARSVALRDAPLGESALLAVVNSLDDVSPVLSRADVTPRVLAVACERVDADGARRVARRGSVDGVVAAGLARNPWPSVRAIAARLADLPGDVLDRLAADEDEEVREAVAARADLSRDVARSLWDRSLPGSRTRELLSKNERVSVAWMVDKAGEMRTYELTHFVTRGGEGVDALCEAAARECGEETRTWLASWTDTPEAAARVLAGDRVWSVRRALADNVFVPGDVLDALSQDADKRVSERAELSQAYVRAVRDHNGDDAALYRLKAERTARLADERMRATRRRVERDIQAHFDAVRERAERGVRDYFWSNDSEFPNSSRRQDASRGWDDSRGDVAPGNKPIVFMGEDEMVECASSPGLSYKDQKSLVVFGGERVHLALAGRDDLCDDAQMALVVHGDGRAQVALARRRSLSESVQVALAAHGDSAARRALSRRFDLCDHARRLVS